MVMGRGSDTRIYAPRSESSNMYSSANEDENKYNPASPEFNEQRAEKKKLKEEAKKERRSKIKHIKISSKQPLSGEESPAGIDDGNKRDDEREMGLQGGPAGSRGTLLDLATGAKSGTGSAMSPGLPIAMSEPMKDAWSKLLKEEPNDYDDVFIEDFGLVPKEDYYNAVWWWNHDNKHINSIRDEVGTIENLQDMLDKERMESFRDVPFNEETGFTMSEPMDGAWSELLKMPPQLSVGSGNKRHIERGRLNLLNRILAKDPAKNLGPTNRTGHQQMRLERARKLHGQWIPSKFYVDMATDTPLHADTKSTLRNEGFSVSHNSPYQISPVNNPDLVTATPQEKILMNKPINIPPPPPPPVAIQTGTKEQQENFAASNDFARQYGLPGMSWEAWYNINVRKSMEDAWSEILKRDTPKTIAARRRRESRRQFRPSTGQFKTPPGGMSGGVGATKRRHAARMRGISSGKKTGLMKPHLSVEMSHRGIATKQPMSKDPQKYTAYRGQSEARKIQGNVRTPFSPRGRYGQRSFTAGPTGAGRLSGLLAGQRGQMSQPALRQIGIRRPRIRRPRAPPMPSMPQMPMPQSSVPNMPAPPSSIMMSEDAQVYSELLKAKNIVQRFELLNLMRRLIQAKEKEAKIKKYVQGGGSAFEDGHVPDHPAGVQQHEDEEEKNDGPTQNLETNSSRLGLDPANALISRRGHM